MSRSRKQELLMARFVLGAASPEETDRIADLLQADDQAVLTRLPTSDQAAWTLLESHVGAIAHGRLGPQEGLRLVIDEVFRCPELVSRSRHSLGESHDASRLVALQDEYDDMERVSSTARMMRRPQTDAQVILEARRWMARNATGGTP